MRDSLPRRFAVRLVFSIVASELLLAVPTCTAQGQSAIKQEPADVSGSGPLWMGNLVIVPFTNISGESSDNWLAAGITETLITDLRQFLSLAVVGHESFLSPRAEWDEMTVRRTAAELGISWIIDGGVQRVGSQIRVTARIVDVETGTMDQTFKVDGELDELFSLQDRIGGAIKTGLTTIATISIAGRPAITAEVLVEDDVESELAPVARRGGALGASSSSTISLPAVPPSISNEQGRPFEMAAENVTGFNRGVIRESQFGVASGVGVLTGHVAVRPPRTQTAPDIDGRLNDSAWADAVHISEFVQLAPINGAPATEKTEVYITYDSSTIYFGFYAHFSDPSMLRANRKDRDVRTGDDVFWVYFDPFLDQQRAYSFGVNAYGVQMDAIVSTRGGGGFRGRRGGFSGNRLPFGDASWDALFTSAGEFVSDGYTAEVAIPFKSLRYPQRNDTASHQWGFQIARRLREKNEIAVWSPVARDVAGFLPQMGVLEGMTGLSTSRNIEILPTFTAMQFGSLDTVGGFSNDDPQPEGGVNFKYGVTSNLTADLTYNPDFSQIESDQPQIEVNQRYALFYPELRPFFLEGAEIFNLRTPVRVLHTRTIVDPRYGAKLTGKTGNTTIGVMYTDDEAPGNLDDSDDPGFGHSAQTFVGRMRYDLYSESHIGGIFTDREFLNSHSRLAGLDSNFRVGDTHEMAVKVLGTQHRDLDGVDTTGHLLNANIRKAGRNLNYLFAAYSLSPDFKTDVGFVRRTNQRWTFNEIGYRWWPESWLLNWGPRVRYSRSYTFDGILEDEQSSVGADFGFADNMNLNADVSRDMERFGGIDFFKTRYRFFGVVSTIRQFSFGLGGNGGDQIFFDDENPYLGAETGWNAFINLRLIPQLESRISLDTNRFKDPHNPNDLVFDVKILRALTTYQFTDRFLFRNISEYNSFDQKLSLNFLLTYRVNAGTAFYVGYDDRYQQADRIHRDTNGDGIDDRFFQSTALKRTNRAIFTKFQYLFRY